MCLHSSSKTVPKHMDFSYVALAQTGDAPPTESSEDYEVVLTLGRRLNSLEANISEGVGKKATFSFIPTVTGELVARGVAEYGHNVVHVLLRQRLPKSNDLSRLNKCPNVRPRHPFPAV